MILAQFSDSLKNVFDGEPWYGHSLHRKLADLPQEHRFIKLPGAHSVFELLGHILAWRNFLLEKLNGNATFRIVDDSDGTWPPAEETNEAWEQRLQDLRRNQELILDHIASLDKSFLLTPVPGFRYTFAYLIEGIIQHDAYHIGQIGLISKLLSTSGS